MQPARETVDLSAYPDFVMILLGFRLRRPSALGAFFQLGRGFAQIARQPPDGLLASENFLFGWNHLGIRQYWRDMASLETFTRAEPHAEWWRRFARPQAATGFWHEVYSARGGVEALYLGMPETGFGLGRFAPRLAPAGRLKSGRGRLEADREARAAAGAGAG
ncbi:monooxygenase family protein [Acidisoma sp. C75]